MAVLIEAISVVIKRVAIDEKFPGGWEAFVEDVPNQTFCADSTLARVGFMSPVDVESYIKSLEKKKIVYLRDGKADDLVVVDQQRGFSATCNWTELRHGTLNGNSSKRVAGCQSTEGAKDPLITQDGWKYDGSLSQTFAFVPIEHMDKSLKFLKHENGLDVYYNILTEKKIYIGRTGEK